jgi:ArsR family transcriptional regulator
MNFQQAKVRAQILKALAHPVRVLIVETLSKGDRCVCVLNRLADIDQSSISRHLASLKKAGIVSARRDGMKVFYHLRTPCILNALKCVVGVMKAEAKNKKMLLKEGTKK